MGDEAETIEGLEQATPQPAAAAPTPAASSSSSPGPDVEITEEPRRGPGRPKGSKSKSKSKSKRAKPAKPSRAAKPSRVDVDDDDDDDGGELEQLEPRAPAAAQGEGEGEQLEGPETPEQRRERYSKMRAKIVEHGPSWERRLAPLEPAFALALVAGAGSTVPAEAEFTVEIPTNTSGSHRRVKLSGPRVIVNALAQLAAAYAPDGISEVVAHPCAPAVGALADVASAVVMARLAALFGGSIQVRPAEENDNGREQEQAPASAAVG